MDPAVGYANCIPRVSLEGSGPAGIRSEWDQGTKREQSKYLPDRLAFAFINSFGQEPLPV